MGGHARGLVRNRGWQVMSALDGLFGLRRLFIQGSEVAFRQALEFWARASAFLSV